MFLNRSKFKTVSFIFLQFLVVIAIGLSALSYADDKPDPKTVQIISQTVLELKEANPNVEITREMVINALKKKHDKEQVLLNKKQQRLEELKAQNRSDERRIIEKAIKSNDTGYLQRFIADKYKVSSLEALDMLINYDERAYIAVREIIMNAGT